MAKKWKLEPSEVTWGTTGLTSGGRTKARQNRNLDSRGLTLRLTHLPTGIFAEGTIQTGNYSKNQMKQQKEKLHQSLFVELEKKVAKHLRIPGF
ncbi:MAG: hypothetical protein HRT45_14670 [Bdellovibrionales bacterium]|nr:hypothetical protein [Bdellovibrionales bacterium]